MKGKYTIVQDTKEQQPWKFNRSTYCEGVVAESLPTGDYTLRGYETKFVIERKGSVSEWATNIFEARFKRELERLQSFEHSFIVLEFDVRDALNYPVGTTIPKYKWKYLKVNGNLILRETLHMQLRSKTHIIFAGTSGKEIALSLFKRCVEFYETV